MSTEPLPTLSALFQKMQEGKPKKADCKGQFYRYIESFYRSKHGFVASREVRLLKRASCPGCESCLPALDDLDEAVGNADIHYIEYGPEIRSGDIIELKFVGDSYDAESGHYDSWHRKAVHASQFRITKEQSLATPAHLRIRVAETMKYLALTYEEALARLLKTEAES